MIFGKARMQRNIHVAVHRARAPGFPGPIGDRTAGHRLGIELPVANDAQTSRAFRHHHASIGQKRGAPGIFKFLGDHHNPNILSLGGIEHYRVIRQRTMRQTRGRNRDVELGIPLDFLLCDCRRGDKNGREQNARSWMFHVDLDPTFAPCRVSIADYLSHTARHPLRQLREFRRLALRENSDTEDTRRCPHHCDGPSDDARQSHPRLPPRNSIG